MSKGAASLPEYSKGGRGWCLRASESRTTRREWWHSARAWQVARALHTQETKNEPRDD